MAEVGTAAVVEESGPEEEAAGTAAILAEGTAGEAAVLAASAEVITAGEAADLAVSEEEEGSVVVRNNYNSALWAFIVEIGRRRA